MDTEPTESPLTERKVVRRGLIAGLAGLGAAAMLKLTGAEKAQAANGDFLVLGTGNTATNPTNLDFSGSSTGLIIVANTASIGLSVSGAGYGAGSATVRAQNTADTGVAIEGESSSGPAGSGVGVRGASHRTLGQGVLQ